MSTLASILEQFPKVAPYLAHIPPEVESHCTVRVFPAGSIIHQKQHHLKHFGIICDGDTRVINEFENGNVFMIEKNEPIDFIGEVTILAGMQETSVTIEALTPCTVLMFPRADFEAWIAQDIGFLRLVSQKVAFKLYRSSYNRGARLFYPPNFLILDFILKYAQGANWRGSDTLLVTKTRQELCEELGITVKTINRTIQKLKEADLISISKGKISISRMQFQKAQQALSHYKKE